LHDYCSIEAALVQYQILLKEVMLNQKVVCYSLLENKKIMGEPKKSRGNFNEDANPENARKEPK